MLNIKQMCANPASIKRKLALRGTGWGAAVDHALMLDEKRRQERNDLTALQTHWNLSSRSLCNCEDWERTIRIAGLKAEKEEIDRQRQRLEKTEAALRQILVAIPNVPCETSWRNMDGEDRRVGLPHPFPYLPQTWKRLGHDLGILIKQRIQGDECLHPVGEGARLERTIANRVLDRFHTSDYTEYSGQDREPLHWFSDRILDERLPHRIVQRCNATIAVAVVVPPSEREIEWRRLLADTETILADWAIPYQVRTHTPTELWQASGRSVGLELWMPSQNRYREIGRCCDTGDYLTRDLAIRYREAGKKGAEMAHSVNTFLELPRIFAAILENNQQDNGSIAIPEALQPLFGCGRIRRVN